jgi:energy-coupling factor transport system ATP-binding protein
MIRLEQVSFRYRAAGATAEPALQDLSCRIRPGEKVGLLGRSGAGRSTLAATLNGTIPHLVRGDLTGRIALAGEEIGGRRPRDLAGRIGFVFQDFEAQLFSTTARLEVAFGPENLGVPPAEMARRVAHCLDTVRLAHLGHKAPSALSGGQKQRLALASVLAMEPSILVLDEPTSDLDPAGRHELSAAIRAIGQGRELTLLRIDPDTDEMGWADRLIVLEKGRIVLDGPPAALWGRGDELEALGVKGFSLAALGRRLDLDGVWPDADEAARAISQAGWRVAPGAAERLHATDRAQAPGEPLLEADGLTHRYPDGTEALAGVRCAIRRGEFVAILGQNGSGKTTLVKHLNGILRPTAGEIRLLGQRLADKPASALGRRVGLVFQNPDHQIFHERVWDEVAFGPRLQGLGEAEVRTRVEEALEAVGLAGMGDTDPFVLTKGSRQQVAVAGTLATKPEVIILDEPTTGLDHAELRGMMALIRRLNEAGHTIVIITHAMDIAAAHARRTILMQGGRVLRDGPTRQVFADEATIAETGLTPPPVVKVANRLGVPALTLDELVSSLLPPGPPNPRTGEPANPNLSP